MYTTKEIQDMCQIDNMINNSKDFFKKTVDFNTVIANSMVGYFDGVTDRKFTTYTEQIRKGINTLASYTEKLIDSNFIPQVYGNSGKN